MGLIGHAAVSVGIGALPLVDALSPTELVGRSRVELGAGSEATQAYVVGDFAAYDGVAWYEQTSKGGPYVVVGDGRLTLAGVGARHPVAFGRVAIVPHVDLGLAFWDSPMDPDAYRDDVVGDFGTEPSAGIHSIGPWVGAGADVAIDIVEDTVAFTVSPDAGFVGIPGMWLTVGARVGFSARI